MVWRQNKRPHGRDEEQSFGDAPHQPSFPKKFAGERRTTSSGELGGNPRRMESGGDSSSAGVPRLPIELKEYVTSVALEISSGDASISADELGSKCIEECKGYETNLCCDPDVSRHLETICHHSASTCLQYFRQFFMNKRKTIVNNAFTKAVGSCCLESLLYDLRNHMVTSPADQGKCTTDEACGDVLAQLSEILLEQFDTLVSCRHSTHLVRAFGRICCGLPKPDHHQNQNRGDSIDAPPRTKQPPAAAAKADALRKDLLSIQQLKSNFIAMSTRVLDWQSMHEYYGQLSISCLVQEYAQLQALAAPVTNGELVSQLLACASNSEFTETVLDHWTHKQASRVWESLLRFCPDDEAVEGLHSAHLSGRLADFALHPFANFPLQRLLERGGQKEMIYSMLDELEPIIGRVWSENRAGVLVAIANVSARKKLRQKTIKKALIAAVTCGHRLGANKHGQVVRWLIQGWSYDRAKASEEEYGQSVIELSKDTITTHGSVLLQHLLNFRKPSYFEKGLLDLSDADLTVLACHPAGSHIFDAYFSSETTTMTAQLTARLKDPSVLIPTACDKYGSRVVETLWMQQTSSDARAKKEIASLLTGDRAASSLARTPYGRILWTKYQLQRFKASPKEWVKFLNSVEEKKRLLTDLLK